MLEPFADDRAEAAVMTLVLADVDLRATEVQPEDFADQRRRAAWGAALAIQEAGAPIDATTLASELDRSHPGLMGMEDIGALADAVGYVRVGHAKEYCRRVIDLSRRRALRDALRMASVDPDEDPELVAARVAEKVQASVRGRGGPLGVSARDGIFAAIASIKDRGEEYYGLPTGFRALDEMLGGMGPGEVAVLSGITGTGKTALAIQVADWLAQHERHPAPVLYFSGEMKAHDLWLRLLCQRGQCSLADLRRKPIETDMQSLIREAEKSMKSRLRIVDDGMELARMESQIRRFAIENPGALIVADTMDHIENGERTPVEVIAKNMRRLKATAMAARVPILIVVQFNRGYDGTRPPTKFDLHGSSAIEKFADTIWLLHKPSPEDKPELTRLIIDKNRRGPTGGFYLRFTPRYTRFAEMNR